MKCEKTNVLKIRILINLYQYFKIRINKYAITIIRKHHHAILSKSILYHNDY